MKALTKILPKPKAQGSVAIVIDDEDEHRSAGDGRHCQQEGLHEVSARCFVPREDFTSKRREAIQ